MATFTSIQQYRQVMDSRMKAMRKNGIKSASQAASYMMTYAKKLAPRHSGDTIRGISKRPRKEGYVVVSEVPGRFKQNLFANQTSPYRTLHFRAKGGKNYYAPNQTVVYGGAALSRGGKQIKWTGTPRFFHLATLRTRKYFRKVAVMNNRRALQTGFGGV